MRINNNSVSQNLTSAGIGEKRASDAFVTLLRALACLLIINSHCRNYYPIPYLAVGGGHGNSIFFILSGYCLAKINRPFLQWYGRRAKRIIPATVFVLLLGAIFDGREGFTDISAAEIVLRYLNRYWFVWAILIYYCIFYFIFHSGNSRMPELALVVYFAGYAVLYLSCVDKTVFSVEPEGFAPFKVYFYFGVFLSGGLIRLLREKMDLSRMKFVPVLAAIALSALIWCAEYALVMIFHTGYAFQFLIHLSIFVFAAAVLICAIKLETRLTIPDGFMGKCIREIASGTLEIYLVQVTISPFLPTVSFPVNWLLFVTLSIGGGIVLRRAFEFIKNHERKTTK